MTHDDHDHGAHGEESGTSGPPIKLILFLLLAVGLAIFFFQNTHDANVEFLWMDANWPVWAIIGVSVVVGMLLAWLFRMLWYRARNARA